jgi:hypothetical protein
MEYQQPLPHNKESGCAPNIRFQLEYSCKDGCRFIKTCSIDTIRCWIATSKEALLIQNSNHKVTQASANCLVSSAVQFVNCVTHPLLLNRCLPPFHHLPQVYATSPLSRQPLQNHRYQVNQERGECLCLLSSQSVVMGIILFDLNFIFCRICRSITYH